MKTAAEWATIAKEGSMITQPMDLKTFENLLVPAIQADAKREGRLEGLREAAALLKSDLPELALNISAPIDYHVYQLEKEQR